MDERPEERLQLEGHPAHIIAHVLTLNGLPFDFQNQEISISDGFKWQQLLHCTSYEDTDCCCLGIVSNSLQPSGLQLARLFCPQDSPGKNTGVGCHFLLQGDLPDPGMEPLLLGLLHWQAGSLPLSHQESTGDIHRIKQKADLKLIPLGRYKL